MIQPEDKQGKPSTAPSPAEIEKRYCNVPIQLLAGGFPLLVDVYVYMPLNNKLILCRSRGEMLTVEESLKLSRPGTASRLLCPRDQCETALEGATLQFERELKVNDKIQGGGASGRTPVPQSLRTTAQKVAVTFGVVASDNPDHKPGADNVEAVQWDQKILDDVTDMVETVVQEFQRHRKRPVNLIRSFLEKMEKDNHPMTHHNRQVGALAAMILVTWGEGTMEEVADVALAGRVHDLCLDEKLQHYATKHLSGEDIAFQDVSSKNLAESALPYGKHIERVLALLESEKVPLSKQCVKTIQQHHENLDGTGLNKTQGRDIIRTARVLRIADDLVSMINSPPHGCTFETALFRLTNLNQRATTMYYDPRILTFLNSLLRKSY